MVAEYSFYSPQITAAFLASGIDPTKHIVFNQSRVPQHAELVSDKPNAEAAAPRGTNQSGMRDYNERLVLSLVRRHGALAKSEIARMTGLSAQTVSVIMRALEQDGLLLRGEPVRGRIGHSPGGVVRRGQQRDPFFVAGQGRAPQASARPMRIFCTSEVPS